MYTDTDTHKHTDTQIHAHTHAENSLSSSPSTATYCVALGKLPNLSESVCSSVKWAQLWIVHGRENLMNQ